MDSNSTNSDSLYDSTSSFEGDDKVNEFFYCSHNKWV